VCFICGLWILYCTSYFFSTIFYAVSLALAIQQAPFALLYDVLGFANAYAAYGTLERRRWSRYVGGMANATAMAVYPFWRGIGVYGLALCVLALISVLLAPDSSPARRGGNRQ
jgi:hypothetical protein